MASKSLASLQLDAYLLDKNLSPEAFGELIGVAGMTIRRALAGQSLSRDTKWRIARALKEEPSTLWPPMPRKRQPGGSRQRVAA